MTKEKFQYELWNTHKRGTLIIEKHDPYKLAILLRPKRSVISYDISDNVYKFIDIGIDKILEYTNSRYPHSPRYLEIVPSPEYIVPSSGVISYSEFPSYTLDRVVAVYGQNQGLHIFGEDSKKIIKWAIQGTLKNKYELKSKNILALYKKRHYF